MLVPTVIESTNRGERAAMTASACFPARPPREDAARAAMRHAASAAARASRSSASAAIQPDIITIGIPGPGCAAPPAR